MTVDLGDYLSVIGHTGAGKSILLENISGFYRPQQGHVHLEGRQISRFPPEKRHVSIVYQDCVLLPHFTVYQNIAYGLKKSKKREFKRKCMI